jgi:hypothetical protein
VISKLTTITGRMRPPPLPASGVRLEQLHPRHLGTFVEHFEIALHQVAADFERMRLAGTPAS